MINNLYTKTISDIHATDIFKNRVIEAMESAQVRDCAVSQRRKTHPFVKWTAVAAALVFAFWFGVWGGPWLLEMTQPSIGGYECYPPNTTIRDNMVFYNGKVFYFGYYRDDENIGDILENPENGYSVVGTIQNETLNEYPSSEFQSNIYGALGCKVYASQNMPDIIFLEFSDETIHGMRYMELRPR